MLNHKNLNIEILKKYYLYFLTFYSVTLSYTTIFEFQTRYVVYSLSLFIIFEIKKFVIKNKGLSSIFLVIIIHQFYQQPSFFSQSSLIIAICLFILVYQNLDFFKNNLIKIFYFAFYFINFYLLLSFVLNQNLTVQYITPEDPVDKNLIEYIIAKCRGLYINESNLIFLEATHVGMILPTLYASFLLYEKNSKLKFIFSLIYSLIGLILFSNTLLIGNLILIIVFFFIFKSKKKYFYEKFMVLIPTFFLIILISLNPDKCFQKISELTYNIKKYDMNNLTLEENIVKEENLKSNSSDEFLKDIAGNIMNPSSFVYKFHLLLVFENIKQNPFGVGFNNYSKNYKIFKNKEKNIKTIFNDFIILNYNDAASNGLKLLGEFGLLILIPIILLIKFSISLSIDKKFKLICWVLILTQAIRGAGYFNSGFILIGFLIICLSIKLKKNI